MTILTTTFSIYCGNITISNGCKNVLISFHFSRTESDFSSCSFPSYERCMCRREGKNEKAALCIKSLEADYLFINPS